MHAVALRRFLDGPRVSLLALRKATLSGSAQSAETLAGDGGNLVQRVFTIMHNNPSIFARVQVLLKELVPSSGQLATRVRPNHEIELGCQYAGDVTIPVTDEGTGVVQLAQLLMLLFAEHKGGLLLLEEPENHLHPGAQEGLMRAIRKNLGQGWAFITTHSLAVLQVGEDTSITSLTCGSDAMTVGNCLGPDELHVALDELGARSGHFALADILILVEGITGCGPVEEWLRIWPDMDTKIAELNVVCLQLNVSEAASREFSLEPFLKVNRNIIVFIDRDEEPDGKPKRSHLKLQKACEDKKICCIQLAKVRKIEHLFPETAIRDAFPDQKWELVPGTDPPSEQFARSKGRKEWDKDWNQLVASRMKANDLKESSDLSALMNAVVKMAKRLTSGK